MAGYTAPNPFSQQRCLLPEAAEWPCLPRPAAGVFLGVGGTNAHAVIEEAPARGESEAFGSDRQFLPLSAKSADALDRIRLRLADHLAQHPEMPLRDVAFTLQDGRDAFGVRDAIVASTHAEASERLRETRAATTAHPDPSVVFMFPGGGAQYPNMGRSLYETEPVYRHSVDQCLQLLELGPARCPSSFPPPGREESAAEQLAMPSVQLPAIFPTEYALAQLGYRKFALPL
jgi:acyl transferase domain-containing protein